MHQLACTAAIMICFIAGSSQRGEADMISSWTTVDADTVTASLGGTTLTVDNDVDVFTNGIHDPAAAGLTSVTMSFEALASGSKSTHTIHIPTSHRFDELMLVGVNGTGSQPTFTILTPGVGWSLDEVVGSNPTTVSGSDLFYTSPFVATLTGLSGLHSIQIAMSDQTEDDAWGIGADIQPVPEPSTILLMPLAGAMMWWRRRRS